MKPFTPSRGVTHFPDWSSIRNPHVGSPGISPLTPSWKRTRGLDLVLPSDSLPDDLPDHIGGWTLGSQNQTSKQHRGQKETHHWLLCQMAHCNPRKSWRPISWPHGCRFCASSILDSETWLTFVCGVHHRLLDFYFCHDVEDPISSTDPENQHMVHALICFNSSATGAAMVGQLYILCMPAGPILAQSSCSSDLSRFP